MRVKSNKLALRVLSTATFLAMVSSCATAAFAGTYYMEDGSISIVAKTDGNYITQGTTINDQKDAGETVITNHDSETASKNTVTIKAEEGSTANVTLDNVNIDASDTGKAAVTVTGNGTTSIELDGDNTLTGGTGHAGLEKNDNTGNGTLIIKDDKNDDGTEKTEEQKKAETESGKGAGSLTATGGASGAGIGGASYRSGSNITITGGSITATAGSNTGMGRVNCGAGIGGGAFGEGNNINITGGTVNATGGEGNSSYHFGGAGIGGGYNRGANNITISGDDTKVTATGKDGGAGIGGGAGGGANGGAGSVSNVIISGGTVVATGKGSAAGIGGGADLNGIEGGSATDITISGGNVTAIGGKGSDSQSGGAGIGGGTDIWGSGCGGVGSNIAISGGMVNAVGGRNSAGIGGGDGAGCSDITISGGTVTASSEDGAAGIGGGRWAGAGTADSAGVTITNGTVTANGGAGAAGIGDGANNVSEVGSVISITGGTVTANGGAGEAAGIGNGENDAGTSTVKISATTAKLDITAMTLGSGEAITGENGVTMASLTNVLSGVVRFFRGTNHYNTVHNGKYVGMADNNADEHKETDAHIWGNTEIIRQATPTEQGIVRHHCAVDGCKGYYEEFFDYVAPAEPVTPAPTDPDTPDVPGTSDSTPGTPAQGTPADAAAADAVPGAATAEEVSVTPSGAQTVTAAALPKTGVNWLAAVGSAISGMVLLAAGFVLDRKSRRQN